MRSCNVSASPRRTDPLARRVQSRSPDEFNAVQEIEQLVEKADCRFTRSTVDFSADGSRALLSRSSKRDGRTPPATSVAIWDDGHLGCSCFRFRAFQVLLSGSSVSLRRRVASRRTSGLPNRRDCRIDRPPGLLASQRRGLPVAHECAFPETIFQLLHASPLTPRGSIFLFWTVV